jgi:hypothetical protein
MGVKTAALEVGQKGSNSSAHVVNILSKLVRGCKAVLVVVVVVVVATGLEGVL